MMLAEQKSQQGRPPFYHRQGQAYACVMSIEEYQKLTGANKTSIKGSDHYILLTTLLDAEHHPALELEVLYQQRWRIRIIGDGPRFSLQASRRLVESGFRPLALNFANGIHPGGGFLGGVSELTVVRPLLFLFLP